MTATVVFPGLAGNFIDTPDVNLVDADTAHLEQSLANWEGFAGGTAAALSTDLPRIFGSFHGEWLAAAGGSAGLRANTATAGLGTIPILPSTVYTFGIDIASSTGIGECDVRISWLDSGFVPLTNPFVQVPFTTAFVRAGLTETSPSNAAFAIPQLIGRNMGVGDLGYWDAAIIRTGTDATFVPSLRIVGDLEIEAEGASDDWSPAAIQQLVSRWGAFDGYFLRLDTTGQLRLFVFDGASQNIGSNANVALADGVSGVIKNTLEIGAAEVKFFVDNVQLGTTAAYAGGPLEPQTGAEPLRYGARDGGTTEMWAGTMTSGRVRDGIGGPIISEFNASEVPVAP